MNEQICRNCGNALKGKYCSYCGEKRYEGKDRSVGHVLGEGLHFLTHFEGTFFNTLRAIFTSPGRLSLDYCNGIRKKYFKPLSFFLLLVVLYLLFPFFEGLNMQLKYHQLHGVYGDYAKRETAAVLSDGSLTSTQLEQAFHLKGEKVSKFLLFINIPVLALFSWLIGFRKRRYYFDHFIFATETLSFFLLWGYLLMPLLLAVTEFITGSFFFDEALMVVIIYGIFLLFCAIAAHRFFGFRRWYSVVYALSFAIFLMFFLETVYKFLLFAITIRLV